jgi:cytochrome c oxidase assembly protein subunit 15
MATPERRTTAANPRDAAHSPWPHRMAVTLACATFPLLFIGGLVTSKGAGLAVPDWPTTFGYNMFLYPWSKMIGGIFYEHSHRLVASFVGLLTIGLVLTLWLREQRAWLRWLGLAALVLVIAQGVLGGLRVVLLEHLLAIVHAAAAQIFFALTVALALFTSRAWRRPVERPLEDGGRLRRLCGVTTVLIYLQIVFGAVLRHTGERLDAHMGIALLVALHVVFVMTRVARNGPGAATLKRPAAALAVLLVLQLLLGAASYITKFTSLWPVPIDVVVLVTTSHLAVGALMLAASVLLLLHAHRLLPRALDRRTGRETFVEQYSS